MRTLTKSRRNLLRWGIAGTVVVVVIAAALTVTLLGGLVRAADGGSPASNWHLGYYTPSGRALSFAAAPSAATGIASLNFTNQANTALLVTDQRAKFGSLLGNDVGKTVTATFTISGAAGAFTYYGDPDGSGQPAKVRLFFETSNAGGFDYTHYWWSNPASIVLANGTFTVTATVDPTLWSDWNGQFGNTVPNGFAQAASNVTEIGLSFGGGYFFENGVGTTDGSGTFTLSSYTVS